MSQAPTMPMYWDAYLADTTHLTTEEHGAYLLLLGAMWRRNGWVPDDDRDNARILGLTKAKWRKVKARLASLLTFEDGHITQKNLLKIWKNTQEKIRKNAENGAKGGRPKTNKTKDMPKANGSISLNPNESNSDPEPDIKKELAKASSKEKRGSRLSAEWVLPPEWAEFGTVEGLDADAVRREADRFRDYWISVPGQRGIKRDWQATWRNWIRKTAEDNRKRRPDKSQPRMGERRVSPSGKVFDWEGDVRGWVAVHQ